MTEGQRLIIGLGIGMVIGLRVLQLAFAVVEWINRKRSKTPLLNSSLRKNAL